MTAPVAPMEARCAVCLDTGSKDQDMASDLDCTACDAPAKRIALRHHLTQFTGWPQNDVTAWAAYLFAQRQVAPVAQPAEQVEAVGQVQTITLDGHQLRMALELINPDGLDDLDQMDDYLSFGVRQHQDDDGKISTGMCCWNDDTDGVLPLDGEYPDPAKDNCPTCGNPWAEHEFAVPAPYCPPRKCAAPKLEAQQAATDKPVATVIKKGAERTWMSESLGALPDGQYSLYLEAQQAGDVVLKAARYDWLVANVRSGSIGFDDWWINGDEPAAEWNAFIDAAIAQGRKA